MIRNYKSWSGFAIVNLFGIAAAFGLIITLIKGFIIQPNLTSMVVIMLITFVVGVAYTNFIALQLRKRRRETYIRKLLGAKDGQIMQQLIIESIVLATFLVVSGLVLAELFTPVCGSLLGVSAPEAILSFGAQILIVIALVVPVGIFSAILPIRNFIKYVNNNLCKPANRS